jgi:hypothetical protein
MATPSHTSTIHYSTLPSPHRYAEELIAQYKLTSIQASDLRSLSQVSPLPHVVDVLFQTKYCVVRSEYRSGRSLATPL